MRQKVVQTDGSPVRLLFVFGKFRTFLAIGGLLIVASCGGSDSAKSGAAEFDARFGNDPSSEAKVIATIDDEINQAVVDCMAEKGFDLPAAEAADSPFDQFLEEVQSKSTDTFVDEYGYGISTITVSQIDSMVTNPWLAYRASLPESERGAFDKAMGVVLDAEDAQSESASTNILDGCQQQAEEEAGGGIIRDQGDLVDLQNAIESDAGYQPLVDKYADCMSAAGYPEAVNFDWPRDEVSRRLTAVIEGAQVELKDGTVIPIPAFYGQQEAVEVIMPPQLAEVKDFELQIARADFDCQAPIKPDLDALSAPYKEQFMEAHQAGEAA